MIPWLHGCDVLEADADEVLLGLLARDNEPPPHYAIERREPTPVEGFDKAGFRRHMRHLIEQREERRKYKEALRLEHEEARTRRVYEDERLELDRLLAQEGWKQQALAHEPPKPQPVYWTPSPSPSHPKQNVEPWFDLSKPLTLPHLRCIAQYTLGYFVAAVRPIQDGASHIGKMTTRVVCPRDADAIATAMMQVKAAIPHAAHLSACLLDVPEDVMAVVLGCRYIALRVASVEEGKRVSIEVTWDGD